MLDLFTIVDTGGIVLWQKQFVPVSASVINALFADIIIAGSSAKSFAKSGYTIKWTVANDLGLFFVVVYQSLLQLSFIEDLLDRVKRIFLKLHGQEIKESQAKQTDVSKIVCHFDHYFQQTLDELEPKELPTELKSPAINGRIKKSGRNSPVISSDDESKPKSSKSKVQRKWRDDGTVDDSGHEVLDFSSAKTNDEEIKLDEFIGKDTMQRTSNGRMTIQDLSAEPSVPEKSRAFSFFTNLVSGRALTEADLVPALEKMRQHLLAKNIANEVCVDICASVQRSLIGQHSSTFQKTTTLVHAAIEKSLRRILTPLTSLDLLNDIATVHKSGRPFTMSFIGVNGVGKSTNLSKVAYWLLGNHLRVLIVACDTFRSGAVEQLRVHVTRLSRFIESQQRSASGIELFERGYGKDPASIANDAIKYATKNAFDVVLIDTAGRRHNDTRLMSGLERFVKSVDIDRIWQVAEALVGTDSISQARHFNDALGSNRNLDGFVISKVDTVGDLVGTLVSMIYVTSVPVVFVGVGQMYTDLRGLSVDWVLQMLLS